MSIPGQKAKINQMYLLLFHHIPCHPSQGESDLLQTDKTIKGHYKSTNDVQLWYKGSFSCVIAKTVLKRRSQN